MFGIQVGESVLAMYLGDIPVKGVVTQAVDVNYLIDLQSPITLGGITREIGEVILVHANDVIGVIGKMKIVRVA
jgi:hypothetical protein